MQVHVHANVIVHVYTVYAVHVYIVYAVYVCCCCTIFWPFVNFLELKDDGGGQVGGVCSGYFKGAFQTFIGHGERGLVNGF